MLPYSGYVPPRTAMVVFFEAARMKINIAASQVTAVLQAHAPGWKQLRWVTGDSCESLMLLTYGQLVNVSQRNSDAYVLPALMNCTCSELGRRASIMSCKVVLPVTCAAFHKEGDRCTAAEYLHVLFPAPSLSVSGEIHPGIGPQSMPPQLPIPSPSAQHDLLPDTCSCIESYEAGGLSVEFGNVCPCDTQELGSGVVAWRGSPRAISFRRTRCEADNEKLVTTRNVQARQGYNGSLVAVANQATVQKCCGTTSLCTRVRVV